MNHVFLIKGNNSVYYQRYKDNDNSLRQVYTPSPLVYCLARSFTFKNDWCYVHVYRDTHRVIFVQCNVSCVELTYK